MPAQVRAYVQVLEVDAVLAAPGREVDVPDGEAAETALVVDDQAEQLRVGAEQRDAEVLGRRLDVLQRLLVLGQLADHREQLVDLVGPDRADGAHSSCS